MHDQQNAKKKKKRLSMFFDCVFFSVGSNISYSFSTFRMQCHNKAVFVRQHPLISSHGISDMISFCTAAILSVCPMPPANVGELLQYN